MPIFSGSGFHIESVATVGYSTIRLTFSQYPKVVDATATNDGLNPSNYLLEGPGLNHVISVATVTDDPQSLDLTTKAPLLIGAWTVTVQNVVEDSLDPLTSPVAIQFDVTSQPTQTPLAGGATNDEVAAVLRKHFNPALKGENWDAILAGIAAGDRSNWDNAKRAFDQLFLSTASGIYLDRRASDQGQERPDGTGMSDDLFRQLAVTVKNHKLTENAILEVLEVFYGTDAVRAFSESEIAEPYSFTDQDELVVLLDEKQSVTILFDSTHFGWDESAYAIEIAAEITRALKAAGSDAYAVEHSDPVTGTKKVRIYSGSLGLTSSVRVTGGKMQTILRFPESIFETPFTASTWSWDVSPDDTNLLRITGGTESFDFNLLHPGDLAYFYGPPFVAAGILGTFTVENVGVYYDVTNPLGTRQQYFEITLPDISADSDTQSSFEDLMFFRPHKRTIYDEDRHAIVAETDGTVKITMPATTQAVTREPGTGAYLNVQDEVAVASLVRQDGVTVEVETSTPHGLSEGDQVLIDDVFGNGEEPDLYAANPSGAFSAGTAEGETGASLITTASQTDTFEGFEHRVHRLREGLLYVVGGQTKAGVTLTALTEPVVLEITEEDVEPTTGGRLVSYTWTELAHAYTAGPREFGSSTGSTDDAGSITNDRVLMTGGTTGDDATGISKNNWDLFTYSNNPVQDLVVTGTMPVARAGHAQASLTFYELICGGWTTAGTAIGSTYSFDLSTLAWTIRGAMLRSRMKHQLTRFQTGSSVHALATGGKTGGSQIFNHCEYYSVDDDSWHVTGPMTYARYDHAAVQIPDGRILVFGGTGYNPTQSTTPATLATVEIFDPRTNIWNRLDPMKYARTRPAVAYIPDRDAIYVAGGGTDVIEIFDIPTMTWTKPIPLLDYGFFNSQGGHLGDDTFAIIGGTAP